MLFVSSSLRASLFVPGSFVLLTGAMLVTTVHGALEQPSIAAAFAVALGLVFFAFVLSMIVLARVEDDRLVARTLFASPRHCSFPRAAIGFRVWIGTRGGREYTAQASDGDASVDLSAAWTRAGVARDVRRLREAFGVGDDVSRARGREALAASLAAFDRQQAETRARVSAMYSSPSTWKTAAIVVLVFVVAYAIVLAVVMTSR